MKCGRQTISPEVKSAIKGGLDELKRLKTKEREACLAEMLDGRGQAMLGERRGSG